MSLRSCHLVLGGGGLLLFVLTGQYMARVVGVPDLQDTQRILYRAGHIYLLLAYAGNVFTGYAMRRGEAINPAQRLASLLLLLAPLLLTWSFFTELASGELERPTASIGLFMLFASAAILLTDTIIRSWRDRPPGNN